MDDFILRQAAIDALWKALYEYEDKTEKQFQESDELDVRDWMLPRIFVQNMNDIDRQTILNLPSAEPDYNLDGYSSRLWKAAYERGKAEAERKKGKWEPHNTYHGDDTSGFVDPDWRCSECGKQATVNQWMLYELSNFYPNCGADMKG